VILGFLAVLAQRDPAQGRILKHRMVTMKKGSRFIRGNFNLK